MQFDENPIFITVDSYSEGILFVQEDISVQTIKEIIEQCEEERRKEIWEIEYEEEAFAEQYLGKNRGKIEYLIDASKWPSKEIFEQYEDIVNKECKVEKIKVRLFRRLDKMGVKYKYNKMVNGIEVSSWE